MRVELLTTAGCHLCEEAERLLRTATPRVEVVRVEIGDDDVAIERYGRRIPVLRRSGTELDWPFSLLDVRRFLDPEPFRAD